eukprot:COSAG02_NODE_3342_length_6899_cov_3.768529_3_plen_81_part_00
MTRPLVARYASSTLYKLPSHDGRGATPSKHDLLNAESEFLHESVWISHCFLRFLHARWWVRVPVGDCRNSWILLPPPRAP